MFLSFVGFVCFACCNIYLKLYMYVLYGTLIAAVFLLFKCNCYIYKEINFKSYEVDLVYRKHECYVTDR